MDPLHVLVITPSLWPIHRCPLGRAAMDFVDACHGAGARVSVLTTALGSSQREPLARRLGLLALPTPTGNPEVRLYEGQTPSASAQVWAPESDDWARLGPAGIQLARQRAPVDVVHAFDGAAAALVGIRGHATVATLTSLAPSIDDSWAAAIESASAVVVPSAHFAAHPSSSWRSVLAGARRVVGIPHGARCPAPVAGQSRLHAELGLPARYPIAVTQGPVDLRVTGELDAIAGLALSWVAILDASSPARAAMDALARERPRRVLVLGIDDPRAALAQRAADLHVFAAPYRPSPQSLLGRAAQGVAVCHSSGEFADRIVHWDGQSQTGNGFLFGDGELGSSLQQACAALSRSGDLLRRRAAEIDISWARTARNVLQLYRELRSS